MGSSGTEVESVDEDGNEMPFRNAVNPNIRDHRQRSCMHAAAELGDVVLCELLYQRGTDIHLRDDEGRSALHYCGMWSQAGCVDWFLVKNVEVDVRDHLDRTCLHYVSYFGNYQVVHTLLRRSADVNAKDVNGDTPLLCALHEYDNNDKSEIIQLLLEYGADITHSNMYGRNPIHICACTGDPETLEMLLEQACSDEVTWDIDGLDGDVDVETLVNLRDSFGLTPTHIAAGNAQYDLLEYLIQQGANPNLLDDSDASPLHWACRSGSIDCVDLLAHQFRVNTTFKNKQGQSCLAVASFSGAKDCIRSLLEVGLSPMERDRAGRTPLHNACFSGDTVILNMFLGAKDIQLDDMCNMGRTALHRASARGHVEIIQTLLNNGAQIDIKDENGLTPLMLAAFHGQDQVIQLLLSSGANPDVKDSIDRDYHHYVAKGEKRRQKVEEVKQPQLQASTKLPRSSISLVDSLEFITQTGVSSPSSQDSSADTEPDSTDETTTMVEEDDEEVPPPRPSVPAPEPIPEEVSAPEDLPEEPESAEEPVDVQPVEDIPTPSVAEPEPQPEPQPEVQPEADPKSEPETKEDQQVETPSEEPSADLPEIESQEEPTKEEPEETIPVSVEVQQTVEPDHDPVPHVPEQVIQKAPTQVEEQPFEEPTNAEEVIKAVDQSIGDIRPNEEVKRTDVPQIERSVPEDNVPSITVESPEEPMVEMEDEEETPGRPTGITGVLFGWVVNIFPSLAFLFNSRRKK